MSTKQTAPSYSKTETLFAEFMEAEFEEDFKALGIDPSTATHAKPGSDEKVIMLAARYSAGLPLWHGEDRYDHGPGGGSSNVDLSHLMLRGDGELDSVDVN
jgi:hypothetical protein